MINENVRLSDSFLKFFNSEKSSGIILIFVTLLSLGIANSELGPSYYAFWKTDFFGLSLSEWINDALMAVFFLLIGLELEREIYTGELSNLKSASLPLFAAIGGILAPALIHNYLNHDIFTQNGFGIPMATDIAFSLGVLALLGNRTPTSLKIFLVAFAVLDDLGAIIVISLFYTEGLLYGYLFLGLLLWTILLFLKGKYTASIYPYILAGILLWYLILKSGIHPTIAGVLLAFSIPFKSDKKNKESLSLQLENLLHKPVAFAILPIFALANTAITIDSSLIDSIISENTLGIFLGLMVGKPLGVFIASYLAIRLGFSKLPSQLNWKYLIGAGLLGGIGFTMSIFITNLAFPLLESTINESKISIIVTSAIAGILGFLWLWLLSRDTTSTIKKY